MLGAVTEKARSPSFSLVRRVTRSLLLAERFEARPSIRRCCFDQIVEVGGCSSIDGLMDKQAELAFNPLLDRQPMERSEC